jgi:UDP-glucose-4-epimerase GalE
MHFAAFSYVGESNVEPLKYYANNVGGAVYLLEACVRFSCRQFVFSSSCATYGTPAHVPLTELHSQFPINPYGYTKLVVERMLRDTDAAHGVRYVALRYFNAAGSDPEGELGELHEPETHLIPLILLAAAGRRSSVKIFGNDYSTADGTCIRDYVHVSDLADAHVAALRWLDAGNNSDAFNLGNGNGFSVAEVIKASEYATGKRLNTEVCPRRPGDPPVLISDSTKARKQLGWTPKFPSLDQQISHAWKWICDELPKRAIGSRGDRGS